MTRACGIIHVNGNKLLFPFANGVRDSLSHIDVRKVGYIPLAAFHPFHVQIGQCLDVQLRESLLLIEYLGRRWLKLLMKFINISVVMQRMLVCVPCCREISFEMMK